MSGQVLGAQLAFRCCGTTYPEPVAGPCWQLYVVMTGLVSQWPTFTWPTSPEIPAVTERAEALASLGYVLADGAEWSWTEDTGPEYHRHPARVTLMAGAGVQPLDGGAA